MDSTTSLQQTFESGNIALGTWSVITSPTSAEIMGKAGLDFLILDLEHGPLNLETAQDMIRALEGTECAPLLRVPTNEEWWILRVLETGCAGVAVPQITSVDAAKKAVNAVRYHPKGERGFSPFTRSAGYTAEDSDEIAQEKNESTFCMLMIEGEDGIADLDKIINISGVDAIYIGTYDLSQSLGYPGEPTHPDVVEHVESIVERVRNENIAVGCLAESTSQIEQWKDIGIQLIPYKADCAILYEAIEDLQ